MAANNNSIRLGHETLTALACRERAQQHQQARDMGESSLGLTMGSPGSRSRLSLGSSSQARVHREVEASSTRDDLAPFERLSSSRYNIIIHDMQGSFDERWHKETSSCLSPIDEMAITLDDVAFLLHLPIRGKLLDHSRIRRDEAVDMMVIYLGADPMEAQMQCEDTRGAYVKLYWFETSYKKNLDLVDDPDGNDLLVGYHRECALRCYFLFLVGTSMFVEKNVTNVDVAYLKYFIDLTAIHEWNWGANCLAYLYSKMSEGMNPCPLHRIHEFERVRTYTKDYTCACLCLPHKWNDVFVPFCVYIDQTQHYDIEWMPYTSH
ncbi:protein MAIN-LIKE 2-like [Vicia villosa]|uniref:protein MAIN-LIKE 2-like n=1 Tax=Vicia villosa TaxID=3911 RepID=UPI00273CEE97|nr:protein MAIN-LIKE 2-like [Vicia villosa]